MNIELDGVSLDLSFLPEDVQEKTADAVKSAWSAGTAGLKENRDRALREKKEAQEQARNAAEGNNAEVAIKLSQTQEKVSELESELRVQTHNAEQATKKLADATAQSGEWESKHNDLVKHTGLTQQLAEIGVDNPALMDGARALLMQQVSLGEEGALLMGDKAIAEALKEWRDTDAGKAYVSAGGNAGSNADGGKGAEGQGPNPFKQGADFSLSKQAEIANSNPELAKQMESEAGVSAYPTPAINAQGANPLSRGLGNSL